MEFQVDSAAVSKLGSPTFRSRDRRIFLQIGLQATLYFEQGLSAETRQRVRACLEAYLTIAGPRLRWMTVQNGERWERVNDERAASFLQSLDSPAEDTWEMQWHAARFADEPSEFSFEVFAQDRVGGRLSFLRFALPLGHPPEAFAALVVTMCQELQAFHGYGGIAFLESTDPGIKDQGQPTVYALAQRFPGIEVDRPLLHVIYLEPGGMKGVNWLTVLGDPFIEAMGGMARLRSALPEVFILHPFDGGVVIQAGPVPQTGDRNQNLWIPLYAELARLLKPIRISEHGNFDYASTNRFTHESTIEWLTRFDRDPW